MEDGDKFFDLFDLNRVTTPTVEVFYIPLSEGKDEERS